MFKKLITVGLFFFVLGGTQAKQLLDRVVAVINNEVITASELEKQMDLSKKQIAAQRMQIPEESVLRKQVLQHLIDTNLQMQMVKQNSITLDAAEVDGAIEKIATMNHMTIDQLREELAKQSLNWKEYKKNIRKEMLLNRVQQKVLGKDLTVTNEQVEQYLKTAPKLENAQATYHLHHIVIPLSEEPSVEELSKAHDKASTLLVKMNKGQEVSDLVFKESSEGMTLDGGDLGVRHLAELPEIFAKEAVKMKVGQVVGPLRTGNGLQLIKLVALDGENQRHTVTQTHVRHILLKPDASMLPSEAMKQVSNIYQQLKTGKDFAVMAKKYSLDVASSAKGGDLGWVTAGELVPEFERVMNGLPLHQISRPVKTVFGWHLIEVLDRRQKDDTEAFKKQQVRQFLQQRKFAEALQTWQQHLRTEAYVNIVEKDLA